MPGDGLTMALKAPVHNRFMQLLKLSKEPVEVE